MVCVFLAVLTNPFLFKAGKMRNKPAAQSCIDNTYSRNIVCVEKHLNSVAPLLNFRRKHENYGNICVCVCVYCS